MVLLVIVMCYGILNKMLEQNTNIGKKDSQLDRMEKGHILNRRYMYMCAEGDDIIASNSQELKDVTVKLVEAI